MHLTTSLTLLLAICAQPADKPAATAEKCAPPTADEIATRADKSKPVFTFDRATVKPPDPSKGQPLARVFGDYVYPADRKAESPELTREQSDQLSGRIITPLFEKFDAEQKLCATRDEIAAYHKALPFDVDEALKDEEPLTPDERKEFDAWQEKWAESMVLGWKRDRALYERYGGVVIFQQANPFEPVGAYHAFLEEAEKLGAFEIYDAGQREQFWHYFVMNHRPFEVPAEDIDFSQPWWAKIDRDGPKSDAEPK